MIAEIIFSKIEHRMLRHAQEVRFQVEYDNNEALPAILMYLRLHKIRIEDMEINRKHRETVEGERLDFVRAFFSLRLPGNIKETQIAGPISEIQGVLKVDAL